MSIMEQPKRKRYDEAFKRACVESLGNKRQAAQGSGPGTGDQPLEPAGLAAALCPRLAVEVVRRILSLHMKATTPTQ